MAFDWQTFLDRHGIGYSSQKKDLYIHCPFCGGSDSGRHMGISVVGRGWGCWRQQSHRGKSPERLIQALIGCSWTEAQQIAGNGAATSLGGLGGFVANMERLAGKAPPADAVASALVKPKTFKRLAGATGQGRLFYDYLKDRDFSANQVQWLCQEYDLHYAMTGDWSYRLVIPVHGPNGKWFTWTARAITSLAKLRYKTLTRDPDKAGDGPIALGPITDCLLGLPRLREGGRTLVIAEGPFDALRLALFVGDYDMQATCLFGKAISDAQIDLLAALRPAYRNMVLLLDPDAALDSLTLQTRVAPLGVQSYLLPGDDDPGEMRPSAIRALLRQLPNSGGRAYPAPRHKGD